MTFEADASRQLAELQARDLLRRPLTVTGRRGAEVEVAGQWLVNFSSNDYLGYADDPRICEAGARELARTGAGATASRLVVGNLQAHDDLEAELRSWLGVDGICLFNSGFAANTGVLSALMGRGDVILSDRLNHASIIDGCKLSGATTRIYEHLDCDDLERQLTEVASSGRSEQRVLVVTESVFSMDGDRPDLVRIAALCERFGAGLMVDEAHAMGVVGPAGRGECARVGVVPTLLVGTFGKALGVYGAFVATTANLALLLWNRARSLVFTTGLPPAVVAMCSEAVRLVQGADGDERRWLLHRNAGVVSGNRTMSASTNGDSLDYASGNRTHIVPVILGAESVALAKAGALRSAGMLVSAIRPPTVPMGTSRLRICLSSAHSVEQLLKLAQVLEST